MAKQVRLGVGAVVVNENGELFLAQRGEKAENECGYWEFPGGIVEFGETLTDTVIREFLEEYGINIEINDLLGVYEHVLADDGQHWVSASYVARYIDGVPEIKEPDMCSAIGWFAPQQLPSPLAKMTGEEIVDYRKRIDGKNSPT